MDVPPEFDATEIIEIEDSDSEELELVSVKEDPMNIAHDFGLVVKDGFAFDGNFGFSARYTMRNAANPCLKIDGIGTVGLPLSERDALAIISVAGPASVANTPSTPGIWEVPADKIHFDDPAWDAWIHKTACLAACTSLQPNHSPGQTGPTCTLRKLVVQGPECPQTQFQNERGLSEMKIADLVIILPSSFEGGQLQLRHGLETKRIDLAYHSGILTSAIAAYVGVWHILCPVTSGYRLSLFYDINQPSTDTQVRRSLPETHAPAQKLRHILQCWKDRVAPTFVAGLLRHPYAVKDDENFAIDMLYGADGQLVSQLIPLVQELGFRMCFAQVTLTVTASASAERFASNRRFGYIRCDDSESDDSIDEEKFEVDEDEREEKFRVLEVMDRSGMPIDVKTGLKTRHLLNGSMRDGDPDDESFEKYDRTSGMLKQTYNRTVLMLWPMGGSVESGVEVGDICDYVSNALRDSDSAAPTAREKELMEMLAKCRKLPRDVKKLQRLVEVLRQSADRWNDAEQFIRALLACRVDRQTHLLGVEGFVSAYRAFGWHALKGFGEKAMENDQSNKRRQVLLLRLSKTAAEDNNPEIASWCETQQEKVLRCLSKLDEKQIPWLMELSQSRGTEFLRDVIFPQLRNQNLDKFFWIAFRRMLQENTTLFLKSSPEILEELIVQCLSEMARTLPPFPTKKPKPQYRGQPVSEEADCEPFLEVMNLLVENNHPELCSPIFIAMRDAMHRGMYNSICPPWQYYVKLSPILFRLIQSSTPASTTLSTTFQPFFVDVLESMISPPPPDPKIQPWDKLPATLILDAHNLSTFRAAARMAGGLSAVKSSLISANLSRYNSSALQDLARAIMAEFGRENFQSPDYCAVMDTLARAAIDLFDTSSIIPTIYPATRYTASRSDGPAEHMIGLVKFCFEIGARDACPHLLNRLLTPPTGITTESHLSNALSPFLPLLHRYLATQTLNFHVEPFKGFAVTVITDFAGKVMRQKHTDFVPVELQGIGCGCQRCFTLKQFVLGHQQTIEVRESQDTRQHLEYQLERANAKSFRLAWETVRTGRPHGLKITKPSNMTPRGLWSANSKSGVTLLAALGDEPMQKSILGLDYETIRAEITGVKAGSNIEKRRADNAALVSGTKKPRLG